MDKLTFRDDLIDEATTTETGGPGDGLLVVATGDVHIDHGRWGRPNPETGLNTAWERTKACWMTACAHAVEAGADAFVVAGDLFLNGRPSAEAIEMVADGLRMMTGAGIPVVVVKGNHEDIAVRARHRHALKRFGDLPGVTVADTPRLVRLDSGLQVACLPWPRRGDVLASLDGTSLAPADADALVAAEMVDAVDRLADEADPGSPVILAGHAAVGEASIGSGLRGSEMSLLSVFAEPVIPLDALDRDPFAAVVLGHIHKRQHMGDRSHYVGSPDRIDFSEEHEDKGFSVLRVDVGRATNELVPTPARRLRTVRLDEGALVPTDLESGEMVRVVLAPGDSRLDPRVRADVEDAGATVVKVEARPKRSSPVAPAAQVAETIGPLEGLKLWCETEQLNQPDTDRLVSLAAGLVGELERC